ncbi:MAG TPA: glycosyltransferase family 2 protein [Smithella sp.]|nr:glycosyltransferase family 2 protein [Smithella sp.]MDM7985974.1 glycosyltransferase family 2 protein [Smithella sp.]HNY49120.1 glycosyltransferase family 2 protein [Smithella sp.]HOG90442.1 glycosyltransferase family 2 protein [Smithella sp.]
MQNKVAIFIVNYNSNAVLARCLECVVGQQFIASDIFVLDNGSKDPIPEDYSLRFPSVFFFKSENNIGFAAGNNLLLQKTKGYDWIALVNPDAFLEPEWLSKMLKAARIHPEYSFFASRLVQDENQEKLDGDGDTMHISGLAWRTGHGQPVSRASIESREIFSPCAAAALYRRDAFELMNGFDEDFFCYLEDVDLGFRLRLAGHRCLLVPEAVAYHVGSATAGGRRSDFAVYYGHRNLVWTYVKNMPGALFWLLLPAHIALNLITIVWFAVRGQGKVILKAKRDALYGIPSMWKKRGVIQRNCQASAMEIWHILNKSIVPKVGQFLWR